MKKPNVDPADTAPPEHEQFATVTLRWRDKTQSLTLRDVEFCTERRSEILNTETRATITGALMFWDKPTAADPGCPVYYQFPTCQVVDISEHLTSNGGQALQYIARSTRLDGRNKGEPIRDLEKARDFLTREIQRLKEN